MRASRPGGNVTGFSSTAEYGIGAKLLELLKEIAPHVTRVAYLRDTANPADTGEFGAIQAAGASLRLEASAIGGRTADEIERAISTFARMPNGGLIAASGALVNLHRDQIIALAAQLGLPTVYGFPYMAFAGGLIAYGPDTIDPYRRAAAYVDRILRGEKPSDLPVQNPTKYVLAINLKTARALGLTVPPTLLTLADDVIE